ncbi:MAG TPA: hypothetical protein VNI77_09630, partial [Nitrososphaera sp.]|nr:hypothetical protein [Nitrososphaera sp.]
SRGRLSTGATFRQQKYRTYKAPVCTIPVCTTRVFLYPFPNSYTVFDRCQGFVAASLKLLELKYTSTGHI